MITVLHLSRDLGRDERALVTDPFPENWKQLGEEGRLNEVKTAMRIEAIRAAFAAGHFLKVATVKVESLDDAFRLTNHIDQSWNEHAQFCNGLDPIVIPQPGPQRSTSVGDLMIVRNEVYCVDSFGFTAVPGLDIDGAALDKAA